MRSSEKHFRLYVKILSLIFLFQSCNIYRSGSISLPQAEETKSAVRIITDNGEKLRFKSIEEEGGDYYGLARLNSKASKKLQKMGLIGRADGKLYAFGLESLDIQKIQAKNKTTSTLGTIGVVIGSLITIIFIAAAISFSNGGFEIW